ncbi:MAG: winged helix-turn-helix transcriptional regulator [candidate division Zixibacteria bacterium]|nr:winged helix-turn-helix transcriptional regulator [candidate division Zixibacteria bacterium]NIR66984.1 winged helix-turn-helix transcriptional regulator [candidate division Zixibacteria bacterium]NIS17779.1 winged helix-turn-helix transcriptional regulator [candidate division Zixibacteria bacterium]NIS46749.1 winged helix-turn-helix transcriptional regulator [candidate division Zixibacteria bacterium]NIT54109.1 winged helix-turn-helix transcriptional regulator [candidate division Zixibacter
MEIKIYSKYFKAFSDPTRLKIIRLLAGKEMSVNDIVAAIGLSQPTVSRHLGILRDANVVIDRREGQQVYYRLNRESVQQCCSSFCDCLEIPVRIEIRKKKKK